MSVELVISGSSTSDALTNSTRKHTSTERLAIAKLLKGLGNPTNGRSFVESVYSRTKCNREEEWGEKFERGNVLMFLPGSVVE